MKTLLRLALFLGVAFMAEAVVAASGPNVLMIVLDDLNDYAGCLGGYEGTSPTPQMDALAQRGLLFTNAHCNAPLCNPSRTSFMTGRHPASTGVYSNVPQWHQAVSGVVSLPEAFRRSGYVALGCGKIFHTGRAHHPEHVWDAFFPQVKDPCARPPRHGIEALRDSTRRDDFDWGPEETKDMETGDGRAVAWAIEQLQRPDPKPVFLAVGIFRPHLPLYAPSPHFQKFPLSCVHVPIRPAQDLEDIPAPGLALRRYEVEYFQQTHRADKVAEAVQAYLASCSLADALVGRLLAAWDSSPRAGNSVLVLFSDHGWHLGEKEKFQKHALWEPATRVPLVVVAPDVTQAGTRCGEAVTLIDIYPTLVDLCGLPLSDALEGQSLRPLLADPAIPWDRPAVMTFGAGNHAVRDERWRYIRYHDHTEELYDMRQDPNEWTNLATVEELSIVKQQLSAWLPKHNEPPKAPMAFPNRLP